MQYDNLSQLFSPIHLAYLYRMDEEGFQIMPSDLDSIEASQPMAIDDPLFADYRARATAGLLRRQAGRKPISHGAVARLWFAKQEINDEVRAILVRRRAGEEARPYNGDSPRVQAANLIAHEYYFHCTGRSLLNRISKEHIL